MTLLQLNEWWAQDVSKSMKRLGTKGKFTEQCKEMGFQKASYSCIKFALDKASKILADAESTEQEKSDARLLIKRATLAKTFKKWAKNKKKKGTKK